MGYFNEILNVIPPSRGGVVVDLYKFLVVKSVEWK